MDIWKSISGGVYQYWGIPQGEFDEGDLLGENWQGIHQARTLNRFQLI